MPHDGVLPEYCEHYVLEEGVEGFVNALDEGIDKLIEGFHLVQVISYSLLTYEYYYNYIKYDFRVFYIIYFHKKRLFNFISETEFPFF